jgi:hypothetical protein
MKTRTRILLVLATACLLIDHFLPAVTSHRAGLILPFLAAFLFMLALLDMLGFVGGNKPEQTDW